MSKPKLTVIIPCKDERKNIRPCIESARQVADEILVADSGSTDGTLSIVADCGGCRVVEREYINSGNFKNWAIPQAGHEWVLIIDADERITPALAAEILAELARGPKHDGYQIYRTNYFLGHKIRRGGWGNDKVLRLFRRDLGRYQGENDHAEVALTTGNEGYLRERMDHFTYWTYDQYFRKQGRYTAQSAQLYYDRGRRANLLSMLLIGPVRFWHCYVHRLGFLDGLAGLQVCALTAMQSFIKQIRLWEIEHAAQQPDPEAGRTSPRETERRAA